MSRSQPKNTAKKKINTFLNCSLPRMSSLKINIYLGYLHPADKIFSVQNYIGSGADLRYPLEEFFFRTAKFGVPV